MIENLSRELILGLTSCPLLDIKLTGWNPRKSFDPAELEELKKSIQANGIIEPLVVRLHYVESNPRLELVAGERRFKAAQELGLKEVPIVVKELTDAQVREIMFVENLQRSGLEPLEEAASLETLLKDGSTQEELAKKLGKSQGWIANRLRLLKAPKEIKDLIISRKITAKHALLLLPFVDYPVYKSLIQNLKTELNKEGDVSVAGLEKGIMLVLNGAHLQDHTGVFDLDDLDWDVREHGKFLDFDSCKGCKHVFVGKTYTGKDHRYCLYRSCWADKVNIAKQKFEAKEKKKLELLKDKKVVDVNDLEFGEEYRGLESVSFDKAECKKCESCKKDKSNRLICIKPSCLNKKNRKARKLEEEKRVEEQRILDLALDSWLDRKKELGKEDLRFMIRCFVESYYTENMEEALQPWKVMRKDGDKAKMKKIPEADLHKALMRLVIFHAYRDSFEFRHGEIKKLLPEVWKERVKLAKQTKPPEKTKPNQPAGVPTPAGSPQNAR